MTRARQVTTSDFTPGVTRRRPNRLWIVGICVAVTLALLVKVWESDWMLERQAARASSSEIGAMAERMPGSATVQYHFARTLAAAGDNDGAVSALEKARLADPDSARVVTLISDLLERQARFSEAGTLTEAFTRSHPGSGEAHYALGVYLYRVFARPRAVQELRESVRLNPEDARAWRVLGESELSLDHFPEAVAAYSRALSVQADDPQTLVRRGMAYVALKDTVRGEQDMRTALRVQPSSKEAKFALADLLARHGTAATAQREAEALLRSLAGDPEMAVDSRRELGRLLSAEGRWTEAATELALYTAERPKDTEGLYLYIRALRSAGKPADDAVNRFSALKAAEVTRRDLLANVQVQPNNVPLRFKLARFLASNGEAAFAVVCYERALRSDPGNEAAMQELAAIRSQLKDESRRQ